MKTSWIVRAWVWLRRIGYCRGFGIQSPWAYSLVRYVINEHSPYYAYAGLYARFPEADIVRRKLGQFYLRLANYVQPAMVMSLYFTDYESEHSKAYFRAGCATLRFVGVQPSEEVEEVCRSLRKKDRRNIIVHVNSLNVDAGQIKELVGCLHDGDFMVLDNMNAARHLWDETATSLENIVTFDMYYCGLIYIDSKRYKQNYIINF